MLRQLFVPALFALSLFLTGSASAEEHGDELKLPDLRVGSKAPALQLKEFVKGKPVEKFEKGKIYVIEFWATWCGPCVQAMPHLTELQHKHPEVTFIGVNVFENDQDSVPKFLEKMGEKVDYRIALDDVSGGEGKMAATWMTASAQGGIPASFLVNGDGVIANITHPMQLEESLEKVIAGKWDLNAAVKKQVEGLEKKKQMQSLVKKIRPLLNKKPTPENLEAIDTLCEEYPLLAFEIRQADFSRLLNADDPEITVAAGRKMLEADKTENPELLNNVAWTLVSPQRTKKTVAEPIVDFALEVALKADNLGKKKSFGTADTLARVQYLKGDHKSAIETQTRAVKLLKEAKMSGAENLQLELEERLEIYQEAAKKGVEK